MFMVGTPVLTAQFTVQYCTYTHICALLQLQNVLQMFNIEGIFLRDFPLAVGTVTGYSGRKKDSEVCHCSST